MVKHVSEILGVHISPVGCTDFPEWVYKFPILGVQISQNECTNFPFWVYRFPTNIVYQHVSSSLLSQKIYIQIYKPNFKKRPCLENSSAWY